jgi:hypothetical protein
VTNQLKFARLVWGALSISMLIYGLVLIYNRKITEVVMPVSYSIFQVSALLSGLLLFISFNIHEKKIVPMTSMSQRLPFYLICWILNLSVVIMGFAAVQNSQSGNGLFYLVNLLLALFGNFIMRPRPVRQV